MTRWNSMPNNPYEEDEQKKLAEYLDMKGYCWCHVPNEGKHKVQYRKKQASMGVKSGVPDVLIFDIVGDYRGIAIELKRQKGGRVSKTQKKWLKMLEDRKWLAKVCHGADEAINLLENLEE